MHVLGINAGYDDLPCSGLCCRPYPAFLLQLLMLRLLLLLLLGSSLLLLVLAQSWLLGVSACGLGNSCQISL